MRSKVAQRILDKTPRETEIFMGYYASIVVRVNHLIKERGFSQKKLAEKLDKSPSEISKWLSGSHNFTLQSISKLEAELGAPILNVPDQKEFKNGAGGRRKMTVYKNNYKASSKTFTKAKTKTVDKQGNTEVNKDKQTA